jgi:hypothetical protein
MSTTAFDTLATVRALEEAGMDAAQAEAVTGAIGGAIGSADTVTRADLDAALAALELRLTKQLHRQTALLAGLIAVAAALLRLLGS